MSVESGNVVKIHGIISTDDIIPAHYKHTTADPAVLAKHIFENKFPGLNSSIKKNTVLVCDSTFGIGSSREQAVSSLMAAGVVAVLAPNFGRIFFRNSWNLGLIAVEVDTATFLDVPSLTIDLERSIILTENQNVKFASIPPELINMFTSGGLLKYVQKTI